MKKNKSADSSLQQYACLPAHTIPNYGQYQLVPIRMDDRETIRQWRNEQIDILRQKNPLSTQEQENYFEQTVAPLFDMLQPPQLLFSFLFAGQLIGYGGLVHINWEDQHAEISFLLETSRTKNIAVFQQEWTVYLHLIRQVAFHALSFKKIYTYAYDLRPHLTTTLLANEFIEEARLKRHICINGHWIDILIHALHNK